MIKMKMFTSWKEVLQEEMQKEYFCDLQKFLKEEYQNKNIYPQQQNVFAAFNATNFEDVKVVIVGQDPYHGKGQAIGLSFAVEENQKLPPSLKNIFKEIETDLDIECKKNGNLTRWAKQGVLLLNSVLTVEEGKPNSHASKGWETFCNAVVEKLNNKKTPVVFVFWGKFAQNYEKLVTNKNHYILKAAHPSPFSAYRGFFGCKHFSQINKILKENDMKIINWE